MAEITGDYAEHSKDDLREEIDRRNLEQPGSRASKDDLIEVLDGDDQDHATPPAGTGGGATSQTGEQSDGDEAGEGGPDDTDTEIAQAEPATAEQTQLLLNEQHGASPEIVEQSEQIQEHLDERRDEAKSAISSVSDAEAKVLYDHNNAAPLWRRNTEDLTDAQKEATSDYPTPQGDGATEYSDEHQEAADLEREQKNATLPKFDKREQYDDEVPIDSQKPERLGAAGRGGMPQSDDDEVKPWVGGGEKQVYEAPEDTTFREIATLLELQRPEEIAHLNGRYDGTQHVAKGTKLLLPEGYTFE